MRCTIFQDSRSVTSASLLSSILFLVCFLPFVHSIPWISEFYSNNFCLVRGVDEFRRCLADAAMSNLTTPVILASYDLTTDSYLALYSGAIMDALTFAPDNAIQCIFVIYLLETDVDFEFMQALPPDSIFVCHGPYECVKLLAQMKGFNPPLGSRIVWHMNDERPWRSDSTFESTSEAISTYGKFDLVLRNYYYAPLLSHSFYIPLFPTVYGFVVNNSSSPIQPKSLLTRTRYCGFTGRFKYFAPCDQEPEFPHVVERNALMGLYNKGKVGNCTVVDGYKNIDSDANWKPHENYWNYMIELANTVFVLCPSGLNPETFRLYESIEMGAIPIIMRPAVKEQNFLLYGMWRSYPGPIVESWNELEDLMATIKPEDVEPMRLNVAAWYAAFKRDNKQRLSSLLNFVLAKSLDQALETL